MGSKTGIIALGLAAQQVPEFVILHIGKFHERLLLLFGQLVELPSSRKRVSVISSSRSARRIQRQRRRS
jgi:hypothetical protein